MLELERYRDMMERCSHCGLCQATCPVYLEDLLQTHLARARVDLIRACLLDGELPVTRRLREIVDRCLLCTNCTQTCAAGIPLDEIIVAARYELYRGKRRNVPHRYLLQRFMKNRGFTGLLGTGARLAGKAGWKPEDLPDPCSTTFDARYSGRIAAEGDVRARVAYFVGCATNSFHPDTGEDVVRVLVRNGIEVVIPDGAVCCGMPVLAEGDMVLVQEMVRKNMTLLAGLEVDAILTDCTSCGMMLKEKALKALPEEDPVRHLAEAVSSRVWEVTEYLSRVGLAVEPSSLSEEYTYHVPCHRGWNPGLVDAPRKLLSRIPDAGLKEMEHPERCCGAGGAFFLESRELSESIREKKLDDIRKTGAGTVLTQCPSCRSYLASHLNPGVVMHPVSFLARAYGF